MVRKEREEKGRKGEKEKKENGGPGPVRRTLAI